jgi:hypothetical protein
VLNWALASGVGGTDRQGRGECHHVGFRWSPNRWGLITRQKQQLVIGGPSGLRENGFDSFVQPSPGSGRQRPRQQRLRRHAIHAGRRLAAGTCQHRTPDRPAPAPASESPLSNRTGSNATRRGANGSRPVESVVIN